MSFAEYVALGDSMSIDLYPALDVGAMEIAVALERKSYVGEMAPLGAASLLYRNDEEQWPDDAGDDLVSRIPTLTFRNLAQDGATIGDVFGDQLEALGESDAPTLITLSIGGNDLLGAFASRHAAGLLMQIARDVLEAYDALLGAVRSLRPSSTLVLTTVYDPSDGTRKVPGLFDAGGPLPLEALDRLNDGIRALAARTEGALLGDVHAHFLGHGVSVPESERWYWRRSLIEPSARGASEIRRVWLGAVAPLIDA